MKATENDKRDWTVIVLILLFGLLALLLAGRWALRFTPHWRLDVNVESRLDPNSDFMTRKPVGFIEPVDPAILTNPVWVNNFLTPGASSSSVTPFPTTVDTSIKTPAVGTPVATKTATPETTEIATNTALVLASSTNTFVYFPPPPTSTSKPRPVSTSTPVITSATSTATPASTATSTTTALPTPSQAFTATATFTSTPTPTFTNTPVDTPTTPPFCTTTVTITGTSGSYSKPAGSTCFQYTDTFASGGIFQITSPAGTGVNGTVDGSSCPGTSISNGSTINYGVAQSGGLMMFRITGTAGTVDINISDWTTYSTCP